MNGKTNVLIVMLVLVSVALASYVPVYQVSAFENPKSQHFENVNALILGRCRTITSGTPWLKRLFIGSQSYFGVGVSDTPYETMRVIIFNKQSTGTLMSQSGIINSVVFMQAVTGIFYYGCGKSFCINQIPPVVFAYGSC